MPNWCTNDITLRHKDPAMIQRAQEALASGTLLNEFIPVPKELKETVAGFPGEDQREAHEAQQAANREKFGYTDWYSFCVSEWGTKWDVGSNGDLERLDDNTLRASFDSAWSPPTTAYEKLAAMGFEIEAYYWEPGMSFCGRWTGNEDDFQDDYYDYGGETSETVRELIGDDLDERYCISEMMAEWEAENAEEE